jgi:glycosyltransferase involved in cell wall biosynthesis
VASKLLERSEMKVALVHYWLVGMRGGERVLEELCKMFPEADIFTHVVDPDRISDRLKRHRIQTTFISRLPFARRHYNRYLPLMPLALESLDLSGYDLIISSESGPAKGIIPPPGAVHICYCHSPMRYIWDQYHLYRAGAGRLTRWLMPFVAHRLRQWDLTSAARVDHFIANSTFVASRIKKYYRREATVIHPPVAVEEFTPVAADLIEDYYLLCGELVAYKRPDLAIEAFNASGRPLLVIGDGEERKSLEKIAQPNIHFLGRTTFAELKHHLARCRALIFPGEEDFGMVPLEAQASGRPVIALGRGGVLDSVINGETGVFFDHPVAEALNGAVERFEDSHLSQNCAEACLRNAEKFGKTEFVTGVLNEIRAVLSRNEFYFADEKYHIQLEY